MKFAKLNEVFVYTIILAVLLVLLPLSGDFIEVSKFTLIGVGSIFILLLWVVQKLMEKPLRFTLHPFTIPILLYSGSIIASAFMTTGNPWSQFTGVHGAVIFLSIASLCISNLLQIKQKEQVVQFVSITTILLAVISLTQIIGIGPSRIVNLLFGWNTPHSLAFHLTGSGMITLSVLIPFGIGLLYEVWVHRQDWKDHLLEIVASSLTAFVVLAYVVNFWVLKNDTPLILPMSSNWVIATDILKTWPTAAFGVGPERFQDAYTQLKPISQNAQSYWNVVFQTGSNTPLSELVSIGALGTVTWLLLFAQVVRVVKKTTASQRTIGMIVMSCFIVQLFLPPNHILVAMQFLFLGIWVASLKQEEHSLVRDIEITSLSTQHTQAEPLHRIQQGIRIIATGAGLCIAGGFAIFLYHFVAAEYWYLQAQTNMTKNDAKAVYLNQQKAIQSFPYHDYYHRSYAQTSFAIARNITEQKELSDAQKETALQLVQQAIREAQTAAQINPRRTGNYTTIAGVYRGLIGSIKDSDKWTISAYSKAVETDRNNPLLRVDFGTLFFQLKNYPQSSELFAQAVQLKPDLPVAYYQLGLSLKEEGKIEAAIQSYQKVLSLIDAQSPERAKVEDELSKLLEQAKKTKDETASSAQKPTATPASVELPNDLKNQQDLLNKEPEGLTITPTSSASATP